jgi:hypothetical protein
VQSSARMPAFTYFGQHLLPPQITHSVPKERDTRNQLSEIKAPSDGNTSRPRRLTRKEVRLVCSLLNQDDREFLQVLLVHVRGDSPVGRAVVRGICKYPQFLTIGSACTLLDLLPLQGHQKYARNLAIEILRTDRFTSAFDVVERCARIVADSFESLSRSQRRKICERATSYPDYLSGRDVWRLSSETSVRDRYKSNDRTDYAGAVSVLLLSQFPKGSIKRSTLFDSSVRFSQRYPHAENLWLTPLKEHAPDSLQTWQCFLQGRIPPSQLLNCGLGATATVLVPMMIFDACKRLVAPPRPMPLGIWITLAASLAACCTIQIVYKAVIGIRKKAAALYVCPSQREQVLNMAPMTTSDNYGASILCAITRPLERAVLSGVFRHSYEQE